jgi:hypothetical protein
MDYNRIETFDNFLNDDEIRECTQAVSRPQWEFGAASDPSSPISTPFWIMKLTDEPFFNTKLLSKIESVTGKKFTVHRIYANGQTFGQDGTYHQDHDIDYGYTFCIYMNKQVTPETIDNTGGELIFKIPNEKNDSANDNKKNQFSRVVVETYYNRGILFPARVFHKGLAFNRYNKGLRVCIAWKLLLNNNSKK